MALRKKTTKVELIWTRSLKNHNNLLVYFNLYDSNTRNLKINPMKCKQLDQPFYRYTTTSNVASIESCEYHGGLTPRL